MIAEKLLIGRGGPDSHDVTSLPTVEFTANDVKQILEDHEEKERLRKMRKKVPIVRSPVRLECFSDQEWSEYEAMVAITAGKRGPTVQEDACTDCTLAFQTTNILYGRCWPQNLRVTPLGRLYHGESPDD